MLLVAIVGTTLLVPSHFCQVTASYCNSFEDRVPVGFISDELHGLDLKIGHLDNSPRNDHQGCNRPWNERAELIYLLWSNGALWHKRFNHVSIWTIHNLWYELIGSEPMFSLNSTQNTHFIFFPWVPYRHVLGASKINSMILMVLGARLWYLQCVHNGDTAILDWTISIILMGMTCVSGLYTWNERGLSFCFRKWKSFTMWRNNVCNNKNKNNK